MGQNLEARIGDIIERASLDVAESIRQAIETEVRHALASYSIEAPRKAGHATATSHAEAAPATHARRARRGRRSAAEVSEDDTIILDYIKSHPGKRSEEILKGLSMRKPDLASGLQRLRDAGSLSMVGVKRGATYFAA